MAVLLCCSAIWFPCDMPVGRKRTCLHVNCFRTPWQSFPCKLIHWHSLWVCVYTHTPTHTHMWILWVTIRWICPWEKGLLWMWQPRNQAPKPSRLRCEVWTWAKTVRPVWDPVEVSFPLLFSPAFSFWIPTPFTTLCVWHANFKKGHGNRKTGIATPDQTCHPASFVCNINTL